MFNEQLSRFSDQVDNMKFDLAEMNDALFTVNTQDEELNEELEQELQELLEDPIATPAPTVPINASTDRSDRNASTDRSDRGRGFASSGCADEYFYT
jgi:hypothetical protein